MNSPIKYMIRLSFTALADYMNSSPSKQRKILKDYKYPDEDEPRAKRLYYREAREAIRAYHVGIKPNNWLENIAAQLADLSVNTLSKSSSIRLKSNARSLAAYAKHYQSDKIKVTDMFKTQVTFGNVTVRVNADLHGFEGKKQKIVRLDYCKEVPDAKYCSIVGQIMYEAACNMGLQLPTSSFVIRHIESKYDYSPARKGSRVLKDVEATCENIEAIWSRL